MIAILGMLAFPCAIGIMFLAWSRMVAFLLHPDNPPPMYWQLSPVRLVFAGWFLLQTLLFLLVQVRLVQEIIIFVTAGCLALYYVFLLKDRVLLERISSPQAQAKADSQIYLHIQFVIMFGYISCFLLYFFALGQALPSYTLLLMVALYLLSLILAGILRVAVVCVR